MNILPPHFIIIGVQRCGTTSMFAYLVKHPLIIMPEEKELHYFDIHYEKGDGWYQTRFASYYKELDVNPEKKGKVITGEASPYYIFHPLAAPRIASSIPKCKFIVLLRNPIDRAYSHYKHKVKLGHETLSFSQAIEAEPGRLKGELEKILEQPGYHSFNYQGFSYVQRGIYIEQIHRWFQYFPREQFLIIQSERFFCAPSETLDDVFSFLGLPSYRWDTFEIHNQIMAEDIDSKTRTYLAEYFQPYNEKLYELLNIDYQWK